MALDPATLKARIDLRVYQLKQLAAWTCRVPAPLILSGWRSLACIFSPDAAAGGYNGTTSIGSSG